MSLGPHPSGPSWNHRAPALLVALLFLGLLVAGCSSAPQEQEDPQEDDPPELEPFPAGSAIGTTRLFARVGEPGHPGGIVIDDARVYVGSVDQGGPGAVLRYNLSSGLLEQTFTVDAPPEQTGKADAGVFHLALDASGRLYVTQMMGARVLRIDPDDPEAQEVYAVIPDLPRCATLPSGPCSPTVTDDRPWVNDLAFGPDGSLYVSDLTQATVFRVAPGGGAVTPWFQDPRFDGYGPNGLAVSPDERFLFAAHSAGFAIVKIPLVDHPQPHEMQTFHQYPCCGAEPRGPTIEKAWGVDGLRFGASGRLYVTLLEVNATGGGMDFANGYVSVLASDGAEIAAFPSRDENGRLEVPYDVPADIAFHDQHRSILIPNLGNSHPSNWAVLEAFVDDTAQPLHRPELP